MLANQDNNTVQAILLESKVETQAEAAWGVNLGAALNKAKTVAQTAAPLATTALNVAVPGAGTALSAAIPAAT